MISILEKKHAILVTEFDRYVVEHPEFAVNIPQNAQIVLQVEKVDVCTSFIKSGNIVKAP